MGSGVEVGSKSGSSRRTASKSMGGRSRGGSSPAAAGAGPADRTGAGGRGPSASPQETQAAVPGSLKASQLRQTLPRMPVRRDISISAPQAGHSVMAGSSGE